MNHSHSDCNDCSKLLEQIRDLQNTVTTLELAKEKLEKQNKFLTKLNNNQATMLQRAKQYEKQKSYGSPTYTSSDPIYLEPRYLGKVTSYADDLKPDLDSF